MRIYIDEDTNPRIARFLPGHTFSTPNSMGWKGLKNGQLLANLHLNFDALHTHDENMVKQQNYSKFAVRIIVLDMPDRLLFDYQAVAEAVETALAETAPDECTVVQPKRAS